LKCGEFINRESGEDAAQEHAAAEPRSQQQPQFDADLCRILAKAADEEGWRPGTHGIVDE
jgi:hypothetical protein